MTDSEHTYAYSRSPMSAPWEFALASDALVWRVGQISGRVRYGDIQRVRMGFRPMTTQNYRFLTEIWSARGPRLAIASSSWRGLLGQERHDQAYIAFITELHRRIAAAGGAVHFVMGSPPLLYWPGLVIFAGLSVGLTVLTVRMLVSGAWDSAALTAAVLALCLWQMGAFFRRNRPGRYAPEALPRHVLP